MPQPYSAQQYFIDVFTNARLHDAGARSRDIKDHVVEYLKPDMTYPVARKIYEMAQAAARNPKYFTTSAEDVVALGDYKSPLAQMKLEQNYAASFLALKKDNDDLLNRHNKDKVKLPVSEADSSAYASAPAPTPAKPKQQAMGLGGTEKIITTPNGTKIKVHILD